MALNVSAKGTNSRGKDQQHYCQLQQKDPKSHGWRPMEDAAMVAEEVGTTRGHTGDPIYTPTCQTREPTCRTGATRR